jgi:hypothetical protein
VIDNNFDKGWYNTENLDIIHSEDNGLILADYLRSSEHNFFVTNSVSERGYQMGLFNLNDFLFEYNLVYNEMGSFSNKINSNEIMLQTTDRKLSQTCSIPHWNPINIYYELIKEGNSNIIDNVYVDEFEEIRILESLIKLKESCNTSNEQNQSKLMILAQLESTIYFFNSDATEGDLNSILNSYMNLLSDDNPISYFNVAIINEVYTEDIGKAKSFYEKAYEKGFVHAAWRIGEIYWQGKMDPPDKNKAVSIWKEAASLGDPYSHKRLAELYARGHKEIGNSIIEQDLPKALKHYTLATRLFEENNLKENAKIVRYRRASLARILPKEDVLRIWEEVKSWEQVELKQ